MAMSKVWRYNWKGFGGSNENQQQKSLTTFEHLLEYYKEPLQIHVNNKYTHNDFKHSDELESIRDLYIDFTNNIDDLDSAVLLTKSLKSLPFPKWKKMFLTFGINHLYYLGSHIPNKIHGILMKTSIILYLL